MNCIPDDMVWFVFFIGIAGGVALSFFVYLFSATLDLPPHN